MISHEFPATMNHSLPSLTTFPFPAAWSSTAPPNKWSRSRPQPSSHASSPSNQGVPTRGIPTLGVGQCGILGDSETFAQNTQGLFEKMWDPWKTNKDPWKCMIFGPNNLAQLDPWKRHNQLIQRPIAGHGSHQICREFIQVRAGSPQCIITTVAQKKTTSGNIQRLQPGQY